MSIDNSINDLLDTYINDLIDIPINNLLNDSINELSNDTSDNYNSDFLKIVQLTKLPRKRQDAINRASKRCRAKKRQMFILMKDHIAKLHYSLSRNSNIDKDVINIIKDYNQKQKKINKK